MDLSQFATDKHAKGLLTLVSIGASIFVMIHYYNQIKLNRLKVEKMKEEKELVEQVG